MRYQLAAGLVFLLYPISAISGDLISCVGNGTSAEKSNLGTFEIASVTCFKSGERTSGMNKICYYDCLGSEAAITVSSVELCPLSIKN